MARKLTTSPAGLRLRHGNGHVRLALGQVFDRSGVEIDAQQAVLVVGDHDAQT